MADTHLAEKGRGDATPWERAGRFLAAHPLGVALWIVGAIVLLVMAVLAHGAAQFPGDAAVAAFFQQLRGTPVAAAVDFPSNINEPLPGAILAFVIIAIVAALRQVIEAIVLAVATFGTDLLNAIINGLVARPRPHNAHIKTLSGLGAHSFPSGHVEHVTVLFGFLFFLTLLARRAHPERWGWLLPIQIICVYFIALVGVGRIVEGVHQPSDVVAGYLVAALMLPLAILCYLWLHARWRRHKEHKAELAQPDHAH